MNYNAMRELTKDEMFGVEGGTFWGFIGGVLDCIGGIASCIGGGALFLVPEPTTTSKCGGYALISGGVILFGKGCDEIISNI